jgi:hypothetical protein
MREHDEIGSAVADNGIGLRRIGDEPADGRGNIGLAFDALRKRRHEAGPPRHSGNIRRIESQAHIDQVETQCLEPFDQFDALLDRLAFAC